MTDQLHAPQHWYAVAATALDLADDVGADREVAFLFGLLHDACRVPTRMHGRRAAELACVLREAGYLDLDDDRLAVLCAALELHADGQVSDDPTIGACWDSDRLQLTRMGARVRPELLSTDAAKEPHRIEQARGRREEPTDWAALRRRATA